MIYDEDEVIGNHRSAMIRFATNLYQKKKIQVHNNSSRGWLHISDAVRAIESAIKVKKFKIINLGHPEIKSIKFLSELIRKELNSSKTN